MLQGEVIKLQPDDKIRRVILCTGKVYYDLYEEREKRGLTDIYLLRVEQLYPWPHKALINILSRFKGAEFIWCQEEPMNQGAWYAKHHRLERLIKKGQTLDAVARASSPSPAVGYAAKHAQQQKEVVNAALGIKE